MSVVFTGSDLRDWVNEDTEADATEFDRLFERAPGASWESAAAWLRDAIEDPVFVADANPEGLLFVFSAYVGGVTDVTLAWLRRISTSGRVAA